MNICLQGRQRGCASQHKKECDVMAEKGDLATLSQDNLYTVVAVLRLLWELERDTNTRALLEPLMDHRELLAGDQSKQQASSDADD